MNSDGSRKIGNVSDVLGLVEVTGVQAGTVRAPSSRPHPRDNSRKSFYRSRHHRDRPVPRKILRKPLSRRRCDAKSRQGVGIGDVFVFFGLFQGDDRKPHHRIFGMMTVERIEKVGSNPGKGSWKKLGLPGPHLHTERTNMRENNTIWIGHGLPARNAGDALRLTQADSSASYWSVPPWLERTRMSYHMNPSKWSPGRVKTVGRGQEFVADVGKDGEALEWLEHIKEALNQTAV